MVSTSETKTRLVPAKVNGKTKLVRVEVSKKTGEIVSSPQTQKPTQVKAGDRIIGIKGVGETKETLYIKGQKLGKVDTGSKGLIKSAAVQDGQVIIETETKVANGGSQAVIRPYTGDDQTTDLYNPQSYWEQLGSIPQDELTTRGKVALTLRSYGQQYAQDFTISSKSADPSFSQQVFGGLSQATVYPLAIPSIALIGSAGVIAPPVEATGTQQFGASQTTQYKIVQGDYEAEQSLRDTKITSFGGSVTSAVKERPFEFATAAAIGGIEVSRYAYSRATTPTGITLIDDSVTGTIRPQITTKTGAGVGLIDDATGTVRITYPTGFASRNIRSFTTKVTGRTFPDEAFIVGGKGEFGFVPVKTGKAGTGQLTYDLQVPTSKGLKTYGYTSEFEFATKPFKYKVEGFGQRAIASTPDEALYGTVKLTKGGSDVRILSRTQQVTFKEAGKPIRIQYGDPITRLTPDVQTVRAFATYEPKLSVFQRSLQQQGIKSISVFDDAGLQTIQGGKGYVYSDVLTSSGFRVKGIDLRGTPKITAPKDFFQFVPDEIIGEFGGGSGKGFGGSGGGSQGIVVQTGKDTFQISKQAVKQSSKQFKVTAPKTDIVQAGLGVSSGIKQSFANIPSYVTAPAPAFLPTRFAGALSTTMAEETFIDTPVTSPRSFTEAVAIPSQISDIGRLQTIQRTQALSMVKPAFTRTPFQETQLEYDQPVKTRQKLGMRMLEATKTMTGQVYGAKVLQRQAVRLDSDVITRTETTQFQRTRTGFDTGFSSAFPPPAPPFREDRRFGGFPFKLPTLNFGKKKPKLAFGSKRPIKYSPSLTAQYLNIRATKLPKRITGIEIRPIITKRKSRRKKKR